MNKPLKRVLEGEVRQSTTRSNVLIRIRDVFAPVLLWREVVGRSDNAAGSLILGASQL